MERNTARGKWILNIERREKKKRFTRKEGKVPERTKEEGKE